jgi:hypothetical protein
MAAPSSAHTSPSHSASPAPRIQPSIACGPPIAARISGSVINGPTPIMSSMFSATAPRRLRLRSSRGSPGISIDVSGVSMLLSLAHPFEHGSPSALEPLA